ncbi:MAG: DUF2330 domain-containing protein [Planctomycetota bacterium]|nr:DUF2330 domain-containing protein [Planctomycetota bacterium]
MPSRYRPAIWSSAFLLASMAILGAVRSTGYSCAPAPHAGEHVSIASETSLILWDAANKTEHFIRRGTFETSAEDFGFLVPTPTVPILTEVNAEVFTGLSKLTEPRIVYQPMPKSQGGGCGCAVLPTDKAVSGSAPLPDAEPPRVTVHSEQRIAGQDAVVLSADDADAITNWLQERGYPATPTLTEWMKPYVAQGWKITAFKFAKVEGGEPQVQSQAVCMSFETEKPFYPYREPAAEGTTGDADTSKTEPQPWTPRLLRVFFIGDARVNGTIGENGTWPGRAEWSNTLSDGQRDQILANLKLPGELPAGTWRLTEFEDHASPRPGTDDLWFATSPIQSTLEREPIIHYVSTGDGDSLLLFALAGAAIFTLRRRSRVQ